MNRLKSSFNYICYKLTQKWTLVGALFVVAALSSVAVFASAKTGGLMVHFFDVGQGDAIFIEMPDGRQILIDGGPNDKVLEKLNSVMPFWDRDIDIMILTHADSDHVAGLVSVLEHYDINIIIWNGIEANTKVFQEFKDAMDNEGAEVVVGKCCMRFMLSENTFFEILHPFVYDTDFPPPLRLPLPVGGGEREGEGIVGDKARPTHPLAGQNHYSLVIRFVYGDDSFLFTGDIERQGEYKIVEQGLNIDSDVLKIAHHGSKTSSSELFLEAVRPKVAVISAGKNNPYGHPHEAILQRLAKYDINIMRTDRGRDVIMVIR